MKTETEILEDFITYLVHKFGKEIVEVIDIPDEAKVGERVLYKLISDQVAQRKDFTQDYKELNKTLAEIAQKVSGTVHIDQPTDSGLSYPRTIDIIDWSEVAMQIPAKKYATSSDLLPKADFSIEWLFGLVFGYSSKRLIYIDFIHPKVKAAFSVEYDAEYDWSAGSDMIQLLNKFREKQTELIKDASSNESILWAKLVQLNDEVLVQIKTK
jgi:hypothetical protein